MTGPPVGSPPRPSVIWCAVGPLYAGAGLASLRRRGRPSLSSRVICPPRRFRKAVRCQKSHNARKYYGLNEASSPRHKK